MRRTMSPSAPTDGGECRCPQRAHDFLQDEFRAGVCQLALMAGAVQRRGRLARAVLIGEQRKHMAGGVEHAGHVGHAGVEDEWLHGAVPVVLQTLPLKPARKRLGVDAGAFGCQPAV